MSNYMCDGNERNL